MRRKPDPIPLGCIAREKYTGFVGQVVSASSHQTGCDHRSLEPLEMVDGQIIPPSTFDVTRLVQLHDHPKETSSKGVQYPKIPLEALVKDTITGVTGVVVVTVANLFDRPEVLIQPCGLTPKGEPMAMMLLQEGRVQMLAERFDSVGSAVEADPESQRRSPNRHHQGVGLRTSSSTGGASCGAPHRES